MLASFSGSVAYLLNVSFYITRGCRSICESRCQHSKGYSNITEIKSIDMNALSALLPSPDFPWRRVARVCVPVCRSLHAILNEDVDNVAKTLSSWNLLKGSKRSNGEKTKVITCLQNGNVVTRDRKAHV